jgi:hypothetical protein
VMCEKLLSRIIFLTESGTGAWIFPHLSGGILVVTGGTRRGWIGIGDEGVHTSQNEFLRGVLL